MFVKWDGVPSQADFDAAYETPFGDGRQALISTTEPGVYYILVRAYGAPEGAGPADYTLTAELLPFQVTDVSPDQGGSDRFVTMAIDGAAFQEGAIAKLSRPGIAEYLPVSVKRVDATHLLAVFDLKDAPHGLYDVVVTNADGAQAVLPYRYLVERAVERDVTVGLGGPRVVPAGDAGTYSVVVDSLTNVDTPYVKFTFGAPEMGSNDFVYGLPFLTFNTNLGGGSDTATDTLALSGAEAEINRAGQMLAPGYAFDLAAEGRASLSFAVQTYPGLQALIDRDFEALKVYLYERFPDLAETDALAGGVDALEDVDPLFYEIFTDPAFEVISGDLPWYIPFQFNVMAAATPMTRAEFVTEQRAEAEALRQAVLADAEAAPALQTLAANADAWVDGFLAGLEQVGMLRAETDAPPVFETSRVASLVAVLSQGVLYGPEGNELRANGDLAAFYAKIRAWYGDTPGQLAPIARVDVRQPPQGLPYGVPVPALPNFAQVEEALSRPTTFTAFNVYSPWLGAGAVDLPDFGSDATTGALEALELDRFLEIAGTEGAAFLRGPIGAGADNWVPDGVALPHQVGFQLEAGAPLPVREVRVVTALDPALDPRSFQLGGLTLGTLSVDIPAGRSVFQTDLDFTATRGFVLRVSAGIDVASATASWLLQAIDPETGELLAGDGLSGLLRPGETGAVRYTVRATDDAPNAAEVTATARVLFDVAPPQDTAPYSYLLDRAAPRTALTVTPIPGTNDIRLNWQVNETGSGLSDVTIYASEAGGDFRILTSGVTGTEYVYEGDGTAAPEFLVLARDAAGNREAPPVGTRAESDGRVIDLGGTQIANTTAETPLPAAEGVSDTPQNALFIEALDGIPSAVSPTRPGAFAASIAPFSVEAFRTGIATSQGGIGALAVLGLADGTVLFSGGPDRAWLYRVDADGNGGAQPIALLDQPIYDLAQAPDGRVWATTGGAELVELDPVSGSIRARHGDGITQSVAVDASGRIFVSTGDGIAVFDPDIGTFTAFASTRVDDMAFAPDGTLWATSWPERGSLLAFDEQGRAEIVADMDAPLDSLTFGAAGSEFAGLALLSSSVDGGLARLFAVDVAIRWSVLPQVRCAVRV